MTLDFLSIDTGSILFTLLNTLILFLVIKHFLFGRVRKILDERKSAVSETYRKADESMENAKKMEAEYKSLMDNAKEESAQIIKNAAQKAQLRSDEIIAQAKNNAAAIMEKSTQDIEREKKRAKSELQSEISDIAVMVASKVVEKEISEADHERFINDFIENVGDVQ